MVIRPVVGRDDPEDVELVGVADQLGKEQGLAPQIRGQNDGF